MLANGIKKAEQLDLRFHVEVSGFIGMVLLTFIKTARSRVIPILIKNHSLMHTEMRGGKDARCSSPHASSDAQNLTQRRREAETQSREEGRGDPRGEALIRFQNLNVTLQNAR